MNELEREARRLILEEDAPCVFLKDGKIAKVGEGTGVRPLIAVLEQEPELFRGAEVMDKIVGKAAAMLSVLGGAKRVVGLTMSDAAMTYLESRGVDAWRETAVDRIINRAGTGLCPMEQAVLDVEDPGEGLRVLKETVRRLAAGR